MENKKEYKVRSKVWIYPGQAAWHFITIPKGAAKDIEKEYGNKKRGWNSLPVEVLVGSTKWRTSIFADKTSGSFLLPLKQKIREKEEIIEGKTIDLKIKIMV